MPYEFSLPPPLLRHPRRWPEILNGTNRPSVFESDAFGNRFGSPEGWDKGGVFPRPSGNRHVNVPPSIDDGQPVPLFKNILQVRPRRTNPMKRCGGK